MKELLILFISFLFGVSNASSILKLPSKLAKYQINKILDAADNGTECNKQLKILINDLNKMELWTLEMVDSTAKIGPGLLDGNIKFVGNYHECLAIDVNRNGSHIAGQYCRTLITLGQAVSQCIDEQFLDSGISGFGKTTLSQLKLFMGASFGVCVPAACHQDDLQGIWNYVEDHYDLQLHTTFRESACYSKGKHNQYNEIEIIVFAITGVIALVILLSTVYDIFIFQNRKDKTKEFDIFMAFSFYTNGKRLFSLKMSTENKITCLYGIRVISLAWIILGHRVVISCAMTTANMKYFIEWINQESTMFIAGALASVDTFFVLSGFLIVHITTFIREKGININLIAFYIHRILRLSPSLGGMILFYLVAKRIGSGAYWDFVEKLCTENCYQKWWTAIFFINNYVYPNLIDNCIAQSWYLSADTQLYILSPLLFLPLRKWPKITITFIVGLIIASIVATIHATLYFHVGDKSIQSMSDFFSYVYVPTHLRAAPWLIGILFGHFMVTTKNKKIDIKAIFVVLSWTLCLAIMLGILYSYIAFIKYKSPEFLIAIFNGLSRPIWGICICWIVFACTRGYGGYIHTFLSSAVFTVLSRLAYSMFLSHIVIILLVDGQKEVPTYFSNLSIFHKVWGDIAFTLGFSVIWTLIFESPVTILEKEALRIVLSRKEQGLSIFNYL